MDIYIYICIIIYIYIYIHIYIYINMYRTSIPNIWTHQSPFKTSPCWLQYPIDPPIPCGGCLANDDSNSSTNLIVFNHCKLKIVWNLRFMMVYVLICLIVMFFRKKWHILMEHGWYTANKITSSQVGWWSTQIFSHWQGLKWFNLHFSWLSLHMLWLFNVLSFHGHHIISSCPLGLSCFTHHYPLVN